MSAAMSVPAVRELLLEEELVACVDLLRAAFGTVARDFGLTEASAPTNAAFTTLENLKWHVQKRMKLFGMFSEAALIGCVAVKKSKADDSVFYIERLAVAPEQRHRGHGEHLLSFAFEHIRRNGGRTASIGLMDNNDRLKKWYRSKGFVQHDCRSIEHLPFKVCFMSIDLRRAVMEKTRGYASIDEYIQSCPVDVQEKLTQVRMLVRSAAPDAREKISYQMPAFSLNGNLVYFAAFKNHIGFYPGSGKIVFGKFKKELAKYKSGKGSVQFPLEEKLPLALIKRIVKYRAEENRAKAKTAKAKK
jgi:uncharacterized protein YdhG (YjbR/CyaY superfamily)/ribosomal protein S18 acetylase RimI-like enzyme